MAEKNISLNVMEIKDNFNKCQEYGVQGYRDFMEVATSHADQLKYSNIETFQETLVCVRELKERFDIIEHSMEKLINEWKTPVD